MLSTLRIHLIQLLLLSNVSNLTTTSVNFEWIDWNGTGSTLSTDTVFSFVINNLDTVILYS